MRGERRRWQQAPQVPNSFCPLTALRHDCTPVSLEEASKITLPDPRPVVVFLAGAVTTAVLLWAAGLLALDDGSVADRNGISGSSGGSHGGGLSLSVQQESASGKAGSHAGPFAMPPGGAYDEARCGSWHREYAALHRRILAGEGPQRYAVAAGWEGWADSVVGAVTVFLHALLTDSAFQMAPTRLTMNGTKPIRYEWLWAQPWIDWSPTKVNDSALLYIPLDPNDMSAKQQRWQNCFRHGNLSELAALSDIIKFETNFGYSVGIFDNPYHRERLFQMGLRPDTAYGCVFDFLLYPQPQLFEQHQREWQELIAPGPLKIGVQIRTGDKILVGETRRDFDSFAPFFSCAAQIEKDYALPGQRILWYLITDSHELRQQARERYGDKLLVADPNITVGHFLWQPGDTPSLRAAAMDNWLFGLTHFQVISRSSGYGRTGGFRSKRWHQMFTVNSFRPTERNCSRLEYDSLKALAALGDGIQMGLTELEPDVMTGHPGV